MQTKAIAGQLLLQSDYLVGAWTDDADVKRALFLRDVNDVRSQE